MAALSDLADLVLPRRCLGCCAPGTPLCARCRPGGELIRTVLEGGLCVLAAGAYQGVLRDVVLRYKERGRRDLAGPLGALLVPSIRVFNACTQSRRVALVPVPSARRAAAERGGDHVLRLAHAAALPARVRVARPLTLARDVADSAGLSTEQRAANLATAMRARPVPFGWAAVLVDDIVTTGATLREAWRALAAAGWPVLGAVVVAATPRRSPAATPRRSPAAGATSSYTRDALQSLSVHPLAPPSDRV